MVLILTVLMAIILTVSLGKFLIGRGIESLKLHDLVWALEVAVLTNKVIKNNDLGIECSLSLLSVTSGTTNMASAIGYEVSTTKAE